MSKCDIRSAILIGKRTKICRRCKDFRRFLKGRVHISGGAPGISGGIGSYPDITLFRRVQSNTVCPGMIENVGKAVKAASVRREDPDSMS